jgi:uncharacterized membrane protein YqhA
MDRVRGLIMFEKIFEGIIWRSRFIVILAVVFGLIGAIVLFIVASMDIWGVATYTFDAIINHTHPEHFHEDIVAGIIGAVDAKRIHIANPDAFAPNHFNTPIIRS